MTNHALPYDFSVPIDPLDIDFMGHVNNASYLKWVQDAVLSHWQKIAPDEDVARFLWVALKHEITYRKPTFLHDDVIATVILQKSRVRVRSIKPSSSAARDVLAEVSSSWCCVDAKTLRPRVWRRTWWRDSSKAATRCRSPLSRHSRKSGNPEANGSAAAVWIPHPSRGDDESERRDVCSPFLHLNPPNPAQYPDTHAGPRPSPSLTLTWR